MDKAEIISYIKLNKGTGIAELQKKFKVTYKGAKAVVDELLSSGDLVYADGVRYNYIGKDEASAERRRAEFERSRTEAFKSKRDGEVKESTEPPRYKSLREYFEMRKREFERREEDKEDDEDEFEENDKAEDELRQKALKLCIERGMASASMIQRTIPIGYVRACHIIDWLENRGYISESNGSEPRKVLITREEYENLYSHDSFDDDIDDDFDDDLEDEDEEDDYDEKFSELEDLLNCDPAPINSEEQKPAEKEEPDTYRIEENKRIPISKDIMPPHDLWADETEFSKVVMERMKRLIKSDIKMGQQGAVKKAEACLDAVRDTNDRKTIQVYERLVYEMKNTSNYLYVQLKKQLFED